MRNLIITGLVLVVISTGIATEESFVFRRIKETNIVDFKDENLEKAVRDILKKPEGELTVADLESIKKLDLSGRGIKDLSGIEYMENLEYLDISNNEITDLRPLRPLLESGTLKELNVVGNPLTIRDLQILTMWAGNDFYGLKLSMKLQQLGFGLVEIKREEFVYSDGTFLVSAKDGKIIKVGNAITGKLLLVDPVGDLNITNIDVRESRGERRLILFGEEKIIVISPERIVAARPKP